MPDREGPLDHARILEVILIGPIARNRIYYHREGVRKSGGSEDSRSQIREPRSGWG
jgi:hypothetical protein